jgi:hypothetical protein
MVMTNVDDIYRTREAAEIEKKQHRDQRKMEIWLEVAPALLDEYLSKRTSDPLTYPYEWVETPDQGKVAAWKTGSSYDGDSVIFLFQDGRLGAAHKRDQGPFQLKRYGTLQEFIQEEWHNSIIDKLLGEADDSEQYRCLIQRNWDSKSAIAQRARLGYDV